jgi:mono/diheme cytochrome c family protein
MNSTRTPLPFLITLALAACQQAQQPAAPAVAPVALVAPAVTDSDLLAQGEYLVRIGGCNDCHTPGYPESGGQTPKGTTYPTNLRMKIAEMDETAWLKYSGKLHTRPPMPDFALRAMKEQDRLAIYRFIHSLGPAGGPAPTFVPPGQKPPVPYVQWVLPPPATSAPASKS